MESRWLWLTSSPTYGHNLLSCYAMIYPLTTLLTNQPCNQLTSIDGTKSNNGHKKLVSLWLAFITLLRGCLIGKVTTYLPSPSHVWPLPQSNIPVTSDPGQSNIPVKSNPVLLEFLNCLSLARNCGGAVAVDGRTSTDGILWRAVSVAQQRQDENLVETCCQGNKWQPPP